MYAVKDIFNLLANNPRNVCKHEMQQMHSYCKFREGKAEGNVKKSNTTEEASQNASDEKPQSRRNGETLLNKTDVL